MRKKLISILSAVCVCLLMLFYAAACQEKNVPQRQESGTDVILRLDKSSLNMDLYDKYQFNVQYSGEETLQWSSSDEGMIHASGQGTAMLTVSAEWRNFGPEYLSRQIMVEVLA